MADDSQSTASDEPRSRAWSKLRGIIKDKDLKLPFKKVAERTNDSDLSSFFGHSTPSVASAAYERPSVPRIDTAGRQPAWVTRAEDLNAGKWRPTKPLRRPGLSVGFSRSGPEVIGEGGDDAEEPVATIGRSRGVPPAAYQRRPPASNENVALRRKATSAHHLLPTAKEEDGALAGAARQPTLPDLSAPGLQVQQRSAHAHEDAFPAPASESQETTHRVPVRQRRPTAGRDADLSGSSQAAVADNHLSVSSGQGSHKMFEMHASEGMAHRNSIRSAAEVQAAIHGHQPSGSTTSLGAGTGQMITTADGVSSAESSRPPSKQSRYSVSPEPTAIGHPLGPVLSGSSAHAHLSPPSSSHGARNVPSNSQSGVHPSPSVLRDVAPAPYKDVPSALAPQTGAMAQQTTIDPPAIVASAASTTNTVAPRPRRPSNRDGVNLMEKPAAAMVSNVAPLAQPVPAPLSNLGVVQQVAPPLQSPPYTSSVAPPSHHLPNLRRFESLSGSSAPNASADYDDAVAHFSQFAESTKSLFGVSAAADGINHSMHDWQCAALWWFIMARNGLDDVARDSGSRQVHPAELDVAGLRQHHVNLAKSWWIATEVLSPQLSSIAQSPDFGAARVTNDALMSGFQSLCLSMKKRSILPPAQYNLAQGVDTSIWARRPLESYPSAWSWVLSGAPFTTGGKAPRPEPLAALPLNDSRSSYCYGRIFASASMATGDDDPTLEPFDCVVSVVRKSYSAEMEAIISSQDGTAAVFIRTGEEAGVHWEHARFEHDIHCLRLKLPHKLRLWISCSPRDYAWLWSCFDSSQTILRSMRPHSDEIHMASLPLGAIQYRDTGRPDEFPPDRVERCRLAVFERFSIPTGPSKRRAHRGYRVAIMTTSKVIRNVTFQINNKAPLEYSMSKTSPDFRFQINELDRGRSAHLQFQDLQQRDHFRDLITGTSMKQHERALYGVSLVSVCAGAVSQGVSPASWPPLRFRALQIIDELDPDDPQHLTSTCDLSENLRLVMVDDQGSVVDRLCDVSTEVRVRLDKARLTTLYVMRPSPREDLTVALGPGTGGEVRLRHAFDTATTIASAAAYEFESMNDMHIFERAITGYKVLYDGVASAFTVTRRRMYVGKDKNWDALKPRLQIVERDGRYQMLAFFEDYIVADCLNFEMKRTDAFEHVVGNKASGYGTFGIKMVDAKFSLPGSNKDDWLREGAQRDEAAKYTVLATEDYAAEHEDLLIWFDSENERDKLGDALPAPVTRARKFTLMRRI